MRQVSPQCNKRAATPQALAQSRASRRVQRSSRASPIRSLRPSRAALLRVQRLALRRAYRLQQTVLHAVLKSPPIDFVGKKSREPNRGADAVAKRRKPQLLG